MMNELNNTDGMRLKVKSAGQGLHPSEMTVEVNSTNGPIFVTIHPSSLRDDDTVAVGWPVMTRTITPVNKKPYAMYLVQLPREADNGDTAVWVMADQLVRELRK